jgi:hypothetical protein
LGYFVVAEEAAIHPFSDVDHRSAVDRDETGATRARLLDPVPGKISGEQTEETPLLVGAREALLGLLSDHDPVRPSPATAPCSSLTCLDAPSADTGRLLALA